MAGTYFDVIKYDVHQTRGLGVF